MKVEKLDYFGRGIIRAKDKIMFVENALEEEEVEIRVLKEKKKYIEAEVAFFQTKNKNRVEPVCPYYSSCGGCMLMHMNPSYQSEFKRRKVEEILSRTIGEDITVSEIVESSSYHYRNKVTLHVEDGRLGFYERRTNQLIEIEKCLLIREPINKMISRLREYVKKEKGITKITIKLGNQTNEVMVLLEGSIKSYQEILPFLDVLVVNNKVVSDKKRITSVIGKRKYLVSKDSFFQVNEEITEKLYEKILIYIKKNKASNVLDLYCGTGTIGIYISPYVEKVVGVEVVEEAIGDANQNKERNKAFNVSFLLGKVEDHLDIFKEDVDTVIIDPPRKGLDSSVVELLKEKKIKTILYVSCNPITLGRDLKKLGANYHIVEVTPFDMFPNTYHVECVCVLNRR